MTTFLLIRHAHHDMVNRTMAGRMADVGLSRKGEIQAEALAARLMRLRIRIGGLYSSPLTRTRATAAPIARTLNLKVHTLDAINEIDVGEWQGRKFEDLEGEPRWIRFNLFRSGTNPPLGEFMLQVQARMVAALEDLRTQYPNSIIALVGHGDPIKATIACYAGIPLDLMLRIEISPASVSVVEINDYGPRILCVNHTGELPCLE